MSFQLTFADSEFNNKRRKTRKEILLSRMNELMPWDQLEAIIEPFILNQGMAEDLIRYQPYSAIPHSLHATLVQHE